MNELEQWELKKPFKTLKLENIISYCFIYTWKESNALWLFRNNKHLSKNGMLVETLIYRIRNQR